jgi:hypothetical protein
VSTSSWTPEIFATKGKLVDCGSYPVVPAYELIHTFVSTRNGLWYSLCALPGVRPLLDVFRVKFFFDASQLTVVG